MNCELSDLKRHKAKAFLGWFDAPRGIRLSHSATCQQLRDALDLDRSEFDQIVQYLIDCELIELRQVFRTVAAFLTTKARASAACEK